ncbi:MAG: DUF952 domain-containing protein [Silicimonas sp.]|nr:DUF952 domain-containing protein [Silicimonas sp.]
MTHIYKIFRPSEYAELTKNGQTAGAPVDLADGYVHFSTAEQVEETVAKHFAGAGDLKLLVLEAEALGEALKWEVSRGGALFPHLYRELRESDVMSVHDLPATETGHDFTGLLK